MAQSKDRFAELFCWIINYVPAVFDDLAELDVPEAFSGRMVHAFVIVAEVSADLYLAEQLPPSLGVGLYIAKLGRQSQHFLLYPHHGRGQAGKMQTAENLSDGVVVFLAHVSQHIIIVDELSQTDTLYEQMDIDVGKLIDGIEERCGNGYLDICVGQGL